METCRAFDLRTGFEYIEYTRTTTQITTTFIAVAVLIFVHLLLLLLFLQFASIPRWLQCLDIDIKFEELLAFRNNEDPEESINSQNTQNLKRRKQAAGGLANILVILAVIVISTVSFMVLNQEPGSVTSKSSALSNINKLPIKDDEPSAMGFEITHKIAPQEKLFDWNMTLFYNPAGAGVDAKPTFCRLTPFSVQDFGTAAKFSLDVESLSIVQKKYSRVAPMTVVGTVCGSNTEYSMIGVDPSTPVIPSLSKFPPADVFSDKDDSERAFPSLAKNGSTFVFTYKWSWIEMISTPTIDILSPVLATRTYQAQVTSLGESFREWNSSTDPNLPFEPVKFPECNASVGAGQQTALFSFVIYYDSRSSDNASYVVQENSVFIWVITTIVTLASIFSLQPTLAGLLTKFRNFWTMKIWLRWLLFTLYTVFVPFPFLYVVFKLQDSHVVIYPDMEVIRNHYLASVLIASAIVLIITWVIALARQIYVTKQECQRRRAVRNVNEETILLPQSN